jgi:hypothetical protein
MAEDETGILVDDVAPMGVLAEKVLPGDVLSHIDGLRVSNEGKVPIALNGQNVYVDADALVTCKPKGSVTEFTLLRRVAAADAAAVSATAEASSSAAAGASAQPEKGGGKKSSRKHGSSSSSSRKDSKGAAASASNSSSNNNNNNNKRRAVVLKVELTPLPPLAPRFHSFDSTPEYVMIGGLIFLRLSVPLIRQALDAYYAKESHFWIDNKLDNRFKKDQQDEVGGASCICQLQRPCEICVPPLTILLLLLFFCLIVFLLLRL